LTLGGGFCSIYTRERKYRRKNRAAEGPKKRKQAMRNLPQAVAVIEAAKKKANEYADSDSNGD